MLLLLVNPVYADRVTKDMPVYRGVSITLHRTRASQDLAEIAEWGANLVRLTIHADPNHFNYDDIYSADLKSINDDAFVKIDNFLDLAEDKGVKVVFDIHTYPGVKKEVWTDYKYWDTLDMLMAYMADRYKNNTTLIGYAPINEASLVKEFGSSADKAAMRARTWVFPDKWKNTTKDYFGLVERLGKTINRIDPTKIIVVAGIGRYANPLNYHWMQTVNVDNAVYAFNMYKPQKFGDSGKRGRAIVGYNREKDYPEIVALMDIVRDFSRKNKVRIFVSAYGLTWHSEGMGARRWMKDVHEYFDNNGWSAAYWSHTIKFRNPVYVGKKDGIPVKKSGTERLDELKKYWSKNK